MSTYGAGQIDSSSLSISQLPQDIKICSSSVRYLVVNLGFHIIGEFDPVEGALGDFEHPTVPQVFFISDLGHSSNGQI